MRGRPREFWPPVCADRLRQRRREAARLLEYAGNIEAHAGDRRSGARSTYVRGRAAALRADVAELLASIREA
jgi:hypothetical protein